MQSAAPGRALTRVIQRRAPESSLRALRAEHDLERRAHARRRGEAELAADRRGALLHLLQALPGAAVDDLEAVAVVVDHHDALAEVLADPHPRVARVRVLPRVREAFLDDA